MHPVQNVAKHFKSEENVSNKSIAVITIASTSLWMIVVHGMRLFALAFSHDSLFIDRTADFGWQIEIGRYAQPVYQTLTGGITSPLFAGCLSALYIAGISLCLMKLFHLRSCAFAIGFSGCLIASQPIISLCGVYIEHFDVFMLSLLLACISTCLVFEERSTKHWALSAILLAISVALYQSFAAAFAGLLIMKSMFRLLDGESLKEVLSSIVYAGVVVASGAVVYIVGLKISLAVAGVQLANTYNSVGSVSCMNFGSVLGLIAGCYIDFLRYFFSFHGYNTPLISAANGLILVLAAIIAIRYGKGKELHPSSWVTCVVLFLLLPLALNCGYILSGGYSYEVTRIPFVLNYIILFWMLNSIASVKLIGRKRKRAGHLTSLVGVVCALAVLWNGIVYAQGYYVLRLNTINATEHTVNRIIDRVETTDGYLVGETPVVFVGRLSDNSLGSYTPSGFERYYETECRDYPGDSPISYGLTLQPYFSFIMNYPINVCLDNDGRYANVIDSETVKKMDPFPAESSCKMVDGVMIVKLSDTRNSPTE